MKCVICDSDKVFEKKVKKEAVVENKTVEYKASVLQCESCGNEMSTTEKMKESLKSLNEQSKKQKN